MTRRRFALLALACAALLCGPVAGAFAVQALVVPVHGTVDGGLASLVNRACKTVVEKGIPVIVLDIDTFGGQLDSAIEISHSLTALAGVDTVAYVHEKALSAGALIALSCRRICMEPDATLGDCEPVSVGLEGAQTPGEKVQSPLRAEMRKLAALNGYPPAVLEAMVTKDLGLVEVVEAGTGLRRYLSRQEFDQGSPAWQKGFKSHRFLLASGQLLTVHAREAVDLGLATHILSRMDELKPLCNIDAFIPLLPRWEETLTRWISAVAPLLLAIGFLGVWTEIKTGAGLAGVVALAAFGVLIFAKMAGGLSSYADVLLFLIGAGLLGVEIFFFPGAGLLGAAGFALMLLGLYLMSVDFVLPRTPQQAQKALHWLYELALALALAMGGAALLSRYLPENRWFARRAVLGREEKSSEGFAAAAGAPGLAAGARGTAQTDLRPAGKIRVGQATVDAVTGGEYVERGQPVEIVRVDGNRVQVRKS